MVQHIFFYILQFLVLVSGRPTDMVLSFGLSGDLAPQHAQTAKLVANKIINSMTFNKDVSVAAVKYGNKADKLFDLDEYKSKEPVLSRIKAVYLAEVGNQPEKALEFISKDILKLGTGYHANIPKVIVFLTNQKPLFSVESAANKVLNQGVKIVVIGIGDDVSSHDFVPLTGGKKDLIAVVTKEEDLKNDSIVDIARPGIYKFIL